MSDLHLTWNPLMEGHIKFCRLTLYLILAEVPDVACVIKNWIFFVYDTPRIPMGSLEKCQPIRPSRLAVYREHIYECLVYYIDRRYQISFFHWYLRSNFRCFIRLSRISWCRLLLFSIYVDIYYNRIYSMLFPSFW